MNRYAALWLHIEFGFDPRQERAVRQFVFLPDQRAESGLPPVESYDTDFFDFFRGFLAGTVFRKFALFSVSSRSRVGCTNVR
jgi:hypothetical protein